MRWRQPRFADVQCVSEGCQTGPVIHRCGHADGTTRIFPVAFCMVPLYNEMDAAVTNSVQGGRDHMKCWCTACSIPLRLRAAGWFPLLFFLLGCNLLRIIDVAGKGPVNMVEKVPAQGGTVKHPRGVEVSLPPALPDAGDYTLTILSSDPEPFRSSLYPEVVFAGQVFSIDAGNAPLEDAVRLSFPLKIPSGKDATLYTVYSPGGRRGVDGHRWVRRGKFHHRLDCPPVLLHPGGKPQSAPPGGVY